VVGECAGKRLGFVERDVAVSHAGVFPEVTGAETKPHPVLVGWRPLKDATRRKISPFILGQISRRIWMERRGHVDRVADHGLGVAHAGLLADQHLHGRRNGAEIPAILSAVLAEADQGVAQERDPLAPVPNVVDVSVRGNQVMPGGDKHVIRVEDRRECGGRGGDEGEPAVIEAWYAGRTSRQ
jgi:hypothetical protein